MKRKQRMMESKYMQWAKLRAHGFTYNLATSGVYHYPLKELGVTLEDLEISGPTYYGYEPLQEALAAKCGVSRENVVAATGTSMANHLVMAAILQPGDEALIEEPTYEPLLAVAHYLGAKVTRFARRFENGFCVEPDEVRRHITPATKLIVLTNLHNPTGALTDTATLKQLAAIAKNSSARILVDEVYLEALFGAEGSRSAFHLGPEFVTTGSLTKAYGLSGLRCGWILADSDLAQKMWRLNDLFAATPAHTTERLSVIALQRMDRIADRAKRLLETNRKLAIDFFEHQDRLEVVMPPAGTIFFPRLKTGDGDQFATRLAEQYQTGVVPGSFFGLPHHIRIGIGGPTESVTEGFKRLVTLINTDSRQTG